MRCGWAFMYFYPPQKNIRCGDHSSFMWTGDLEPNEVGADVIDRHALPTLAELKEVSTTKGFRLAIDIGSILWKVCCYKEDLYIAGAADSISILSTLCCVYSKSSLEAASDSPTQLPRARVQVQLMACSTETNWKLSMKRSHLSRVFFGIYPRQQIAATCARHTEEHCEASPSECSEKCASCMPCANTEVDALAASSTDWGSFRARCGRWYNCTGYSGTDAYTTFLTTEERERGRRGRGREGGVPLLRKKLR